MKASGPGEEQEKSRVGEGVERVGTGRTSAPRPVEEGEGSVWVVDAGEYGGHVFLLGGEDLREGFLPLGIGMASEKNTDDGLGELTESRVEGVGIWMGTEGIEEVRKEEFGHERGGREEQRHWKEGRKEKNKRGRI